MSFATQTTPIRESQINDVFYVTTNGGFSTIQAAIDYARVYNYGVGQIIICHGFNYNEDITKLTGGTSGIYLNDVRDTHYENWMWNGTQFVPADFYMMANLVVGGEATAAVVRATSSGVAQAQADTTYLEFAHPLNAGRIAATGPDPATKAGFYISGMSSDFSQGVDYLVMDPTAGVTTAGQFSAGVVRATQSGIAQAEANATYLEHAGAPNNYGRVTATGPDTATVAGLLFDGMSSDYSKGATYLNCEPTGCTFGVPVTLSADPTQPLQGATKQYVDATTAKLGNYLPLVGGTMTGSITLPSDPTTALQAATKQYVDAHAGGGGGATYPPAGIPVSTGTAWGTSLDPNNSYLKLTGGTVTGMIGVQAQPGNIMIGPASDAPTQNIISLNGMTAASYMIGIRGVGTSVYLQADNINFNTGIGTTKIQWNMYTGATFDIPVFLNADPTTALQAATKQYVDSKQTQIIQAPDEATAISDSQANPNNIYFWDGGGTGGGMVFPPAGIGVSTGTAWGTSIDPTTVPRLNTANTFTQPQTCSGNVGTTVNNQVTPYTTGAQGLTLGWNSRVYGESDFINSHASGGGGFAWYNLAAGILVDSTTTPAMTLESNNVLHCFGGVVAYGTAGAPAPDITTPHASMFVSGGNPLFSMVNSAAPTDAKTYESYVDSAGTYHWSLVNDANTTVTDWMAVSRSGTTPANINVTGTFNVTGTKNFRIPHPTKPEHELVHACLEGPEAGVFYRGEGETDGNGMVEIVLPDYFEALTRSERRTVQLTERFDDEEQTPVFGNFLAAGRVKDGKFTVRSSHSAAKFFWEVKAVRADVAELEVEPAKEKS